MPATGVAGGFERLMISLEKKGLFPDLEQNPQVYVAMAGEEVRDETIKLLRALRESGLRADRDLKERPLKKQMAYAASATVRIVVIVRPRELKECDASLRGTK